MEDRGRVRETDEQLSGFASMKRTVILTLSSVVFGVVALCYFGMCFQNVDYRGVAKTSSRQGCKFGCTLLAFALLFLSLAFPPVGIPLVAITIFIASLLRWIWR